MITLWPYKRTRPSTLPSVPSVPWLLSLPSGVSIIDDVDVDVVDVAVDVNVVVDVDVGSENEATNVEMRSCSSSSCRLSLPLSPGARNSKEETEEGVCSSESDGLWFPRGNVKQTSENVVLLNAHLIKHKW